jgi:hypothetical protein
MNSPLGLILLRIVPVKRNGSCDITLVAHKQMRFNQQYDMLSEEYDIHHNAF